MSGIMKGMLLILMVFIIVLLIGIAVTKDSALREE